MTRRFHGLAEQVIFNNNLWERKDD